MSTIFTKIIEGQIPGTFVYEDDVAVVFATIQPVKSGHMLVVPRKEYPSYSSCDDQTLSHLARVTKLIALAQEECFDIKRSGIIVAGFEVPHLHIHVIPLENERELDLSLAKNDTAQNIRIASEKIRQTLIKMGYEHNVPKDITKL